jgi:DNA-directed RNA polymerase subunit H (RpoH/RPB5)
MMLSQAADGPVKIPRRSREIGVNIHLGKFLEYRGFQMTAEPLRPAHVKASDLVDGFTPQEAVTNALRTLGVWAIVAARPVEGGTTHAMIIYLLAEKGKYTRTAGAIDQLLDSAVQHAPLAAPGKKVDLKEVILIAPAEASEKKHLRARLVRPEGAARGVSYFMYPYYLFVQVIPEAPNVFKHEVVSPEEAQAYLAKFSLTHAQLPRVSVTDPPVVWCGGRSGDYIRVWRLSETAGTKVPVIRYVT